MDFAQDQRNPGKHLAGIAFVIGFHAVLVWALMTGLAQKVVEVVKAPLETKIIQEVKKPPPPPPAPPPPPPKMAAPPPPFIPPPEVVIAVPPPPVETIQVATAVPPPAPAPIVPMAPPAPAPRQVVRTSAVIDAKAGCEEPEYPAASRRNEETGTVVLRFLIGVDGRVLDSKIATSSGHPRLDRAARDALSLCIFKPGTVDGKPEQSWASIKYQWNLN